MPFHGGPSRQWDCTEQSGERKKIPRNAGQWRAASGRGERRDAVSEEVAACVVGVVVLRYHLRLRLRRDSAVAIGGPELAADGVVAVEKAVWIELLLQPQQLGVDLLPPVALLEMGVLNCTK